MKNLFKISEIIVFITIIGFITTACPESDKVDTSPTVTSVTVDPATPNVVKGGNITFTATVTGTNNPAQTVTWSIDQTNKNTGTAINANGELTVAATENLTSLTVRATSTVDTTKSGTATVTISSEEEYDPTVPPTEVLNILKNNIGYTGEFPTPDGTNYGDYFYNGTNYLSIWWTDADYDKFTNYKAEWAALGKTSAISLARAIPMDESVTLNLGKGVGNKNLGTIIYFTVNGGINNDGVDTTKTYQVPENSICFLVYYY